MLEIEHLLDAGLLLKQITCVTGRRRQERHPAARRGGSDGPDERQMPDDIADARLDLNDRTGRHVDCRPKGCDMPPLA